MKGTPYFQHQEDSRRLVKIPSSGGGREEGERRHGLVLWTPGRAWYGAVRSWACGCRMLTPRGKVAPGIKMKGGHIQFMATLKRLEEVALEHGAAVHHVYEEEGRPRSLSPFELVGATPSDPL